MRADAELIARRSCPRSRASADVTDRHTPSVRPYIRPHRALLCVPACLASPLISLCPGPPSPVIAQSRARRGCRSPEAEPEVCAGRPLARVRRSPSAYASRQRLSGCCHCVQVDVVSGPLRSSCRGLGMGAIGIAMCVPVMRCLRIPAEVRVRRGLGHFLASLLWRGLCGLTRKVVVY